MVKAEGNLRVSLRLQLELDWKKRKRERNEFSDACAQSSSRLTMIVNVPWRFHRPGCPSLYRNKNTSVTERRGPATGLHRSRNLYRSVHVSVQAIIPAPSLQNSSNKTINHALTFDRISLLYVFYNLFFDTYFLSFFSCNFNHS